MAPPRKTTSCPTDLSEGERQRLAAKWERHYGASQGRGEEVFIALVFGGLTGWCLGLLAATAALN